MKTFLAILISVFAAFQSEASWVIHGALGTNPGIGFSRVAASADHIELIQFEYGVDPSFSFNADEWCVSFGLSYSFYSSGAVLSLDDSWGTVEIPYSPNYGTSSAVYWSIEDGAPIFNGNSIQIAPAIPGEYWIDWSSLGVIRITAGATGPPDFGKYLSDGSINPNYVEPLALRGKGHAKKK